MRKRVGIKAVPVNQNVRCLRIYPIKGTKVNTVDLKTVGLKLSKAQAIDLARVLLIAAQDWNVIDLTAFRLDRRKDGTYQISVTSLA